MNIHLRNRVLSHDLSAALNRIALTGDDSELDQLCIEQVRALASSGNVPSDSVLGQYLIRRIAQGK